MLPFASNWERLCRSYAIASSSASPPQEVMSTAKYTYKEVQYTNGDSYEGRWREDEFDGPGIYRYATKTFRDRLHFSLGGLGEGGSVSATRTSISDFVH